MMTNIDNLNLCIKQLQDSLLNIQTQISLKNDDLLRQQSQIDTQAQELKQTKDEMESYNRVSILNGLNKKNC